ncbi:MAG: hypothetical protein WBB64_03340 [Anaerolineales bacterium]
MDTKNVTLLLFSLFFLCSACQNTLPEPNPTQTISLTPIDSPIPTQVKPTAVPESEVIPINEDWNVYKNHRLGFSIKIPANPIWSSGAQCSELNLPEEGFLPVAVIEREDRIYITTETALQFPYSEREESLEVKPARGENCEIVKVTLELLENEDYFPLDLWEIAIKPIMSENDLEFFVDEYYGDCYYVTEKTPLSDRGLIKVKISGNEDPNVDPDATCVVRWGYLYYYSVEFSRAATWMFGQSLHFCASGANQDCYDNDMLRSFEFIPVIYPPE